MPTTSGGSTRTSPTTLSCLARSFLIAACWVSVQFHDRLMRAVLVQPLPSPWDSAHVSLVELLPAELGPECSQPGLPDWGLASHAEALNH